VAAATVTEAPSAGMALAEVLAAGTAMERPAAWTSAEPPSAGVLADAPACPATFRLHAQDFSEETPREKVLAVCCCNMAMETEAGKASRMPCGKALDVCARSRTTGDLQPREEEGGGAPCAADSPRCVMGL